MGELLAQKDIINFPNLATVWGICNIIGCHIMGLGMVSYLTITSLKLKFCPHLFCDNVNVYFDTCYRNAYKFASGHIWMHQFVMCNYN